MSLIHISQYAYEEVLDALRGEGHEIAPEGPKQAVSEPISAHPDIFLCKLGAAPRSPVFRGNADLLSPEYPKDVLYNAVVTEKFLICNTNTVSEDLASAAQAHYPDIVSIHVQQGYSKCSMVVVDERHFITEDEGIFRALQKYNKTRPDDSPAAECLLVEPGHVDLPGYKRGFIGGASGRIVDEIWFNGDIEAHPDWERIRDLIEGCGLSVRSFAGLPLMDIGSIIEE